MELVEPIERINQYLKDTFGIETTSSNPIWRVMWSEYYEKRLDEFSDFDDNGNLIRTVKEVRETRKYNYIFDRYVLERLVLVPDYQQDELAGLKKSYEPIHTFEDRNGNYLPPRIDACKFVIDVIYAAQYGKKVRTFSELSAKFGDKESSHEAFLEAKKKRIEDYENALYGDESSLGGATIGESGNGIIVPRNYEKRIILTDGD